MNTSSKYLSLLRCLISGMVIFCVREQTGYRDKPKNLVNRTAKHLLPVMGPVELALGGLTGFGMRALLTDAHAVHQRAEHREKPEAEDDDADVPHLG